MSLTPSGISLRDLYAEESAKIERDFAATSNGRTVTLARASLVDRVILELAREFLSGDPRAIEKLCLVAIGGYGRRELFPYSDVDLLFLYEDEGAESLYREATRTISRILWDLRLRLSPSNRMIAECESFHRDNPEFNVSLLDHRCIGGDQQLYVRLHDRAIPQLLGRERSEYLRDICQLTQQRHEKEGHTIFHLEPNLKNSPGGLRDYHVAGWAAMLSSRELRGNWNAPENLWPANVAADMGKAFDFLAAARCFLHYRQGRDDNALSYEMQAEAASQGIGVEPGRPMDPASWMRIYFRHARAVYGLSTQLLDEALPLPATLRHWFENWRASRAHPEFLIAGGRISLRQASVAEDPGSLLSLFELVARDGLKLSREAEDQIREALPALGPPGTRVPSQWEHLKKILVAPHAAEALRAMHSAGLLVWLFPEFAVIDSLVMRDFYHHYTVDAHSFMAIEYLHQLLPVQKDWERPFAEIFSQLEQPELLFFSFLFHDVGKGMHRENHALGSLEAVERVFSRLDVSAEDADTIRYLIRDHLAMSANLLRRDISDPQTIRDFAEIVGSPERLKLLCLFTYADIRAVNPEALTPWKAESLWQFYVSAANYMSRSLDQERFHAAAHDRQFVDRVALLLRKEGTPEDLATFLEGLPRRYVLAHSPGEIATHFQMSRRLGTDPVASRIEKREQLFELTLLATDRPMLFAGISGTLAAWGMDIWKAEAFANSAGVVVDTFAFSDPYNTLELNPSEIARLQQNIVDVLTGNVRLETLMHGRTSPQALRPPKVNVATQIRFDDSSSSHSTLMEIITQDRPGLLYRLSSVLAANGCNIEVALIDTEGQRAVDAFYLTVSGGKLEGEQQQKLRAALVLEL